MEEVVDPDAGALDFAGLTALLSRRSQLVRDHYSALRNALLRGHGTILSDRERSMISNILHDLVADMGDACRRALSARQAGGDPAADALAETMDDRWAERMQTTLAKVGALGDVDLIAAIEHRVRERLLDAARMERDNGQPTARAVPGDTDLFGIDDIAADMRLARAVSDYLVEKSRRFDGYWNPRLPLYEIPERLSGELFWACAAAWRDEVLPSWDLEEADLDDVLEGTVARAMEMTQHESRRAEKATAVADALADLGHLAPALLARTLHHGEVGLFEAILARLINLPSALVRSCTFEPGSARLTVALRAAGISSGDFTKIQGILRQARTGAAPCEPDATVLFARIAEGDAERMIQHWRRQPEYLAALRRYRAQGADGQQD